MWDELGVVRGLVEGLWAVCRDFDLCRFPTKKRNFQRKTSAMAEFFETIEDRELIDLPFEGGSHTWFKGDTNNTTSRIDIILFFTEWSEQFSKVKQTILMTPKLDRILFSILQDLMHNPCTSMMTPNW